MKLLPSPDWQTTIHRFLPRGALFFIWLGCLLILLGWPNPLQAAPNAAPLAQVGCSASMDVSNTAELNNAIGCYNGQTTAGVYTITFNADITLNITSTVISNTNPGVALQINGEFRGLSGANTYRGLAIAPNTQVTIQRLVIFSGKADTNGGGILNEGTLTIHASTLISNTAQNGGGIYNTSVLTISSSSVISSSVNNNGGGIYNAGQLTVDNSALMGNGITTGVNRGGGIYNASPGVLDLTNSTLNDNGAAAGGGILNDGVARVSNSTLSGNDAFGDGGSIRNAGTLTVINSTFSDNFAFFGGDSILNAGTLTLRNTIIANGSGPGGDCVNSGGTIADQTHNLIEDGANACGIADGANNSIIGQDPALAPLLFNGGSGLENHALLATSPAINQGDAATCAAAPINNRDQNFVFRPQGAACDIGAVEYASACASTTVGTTAELNNAISCYNNETMTGVYHIFFNADITLDSASTVISNTTPGVALQINGVGKTLSGANTYRGLEIAPNTHVSIQSLTIRDGKAETNGGGLLNEGALTIIYSSVLTNSATSDGGGIYNTGTLTVSFSTFSGNSAPNGNGGGLYNTGTGTVSMEASTLTGNSAQFGGGIFNTSTGALMVRGIMFNSNSASDSGGGLYNTGTLTVSNSTLSSNSAQAVGGSIRNDGTLMVSASLLLSNTAQLAGGGIYHSNTGTLSVSNSTFSSNKVTGNTSDGGGIYSNGPLTVTNSTLSGNSAIDSGGGIYNNSALTLRNTIIANSPTGGDCFNNTGTITQTHNLIENSLGGACGIADGVNSSIVGQDPALAPLDYNDPMAFGTQIHALLATSPAIDQGDAATCAAPPINNLDQNGGMRPQGAACDIGAVEYTPPVCTFPATVSTTAELNTAIGCYNSQTTAGLYTINFNTDITLTAASMFIYNPTPDVTLLINGNGKTLSGAYTYRGLEISVDTQVMIERLIILAGQAATNGGGILNHGVLTLTSTSLLTNSVDNDGGGGIYNTGWLMVRSSTLSGNSASGGPYDGGGIYNAGIGTVTVSDSTLSRNVAGNSGGGIYNAGSDALTAGSGALTVSNSTFSGNEAMDGSGGGIASEGTLTVTNSTLNDNEVSFNDNGGGGLYFTGTLTLRNTIIANSPGGGDCVKAGGTITQTHNLIEDGANACGIANGANNSIVGQDPALAPLAYNGGNGPHTHALLATSPAIDHGDDATCAAPPINNLDQNGDSRPQGPACDIGAVEFPVFTEHELLVFRTGSGSGTIKSTPTGIDCGDDCFDFFDHDATITLTATPDVGSTFAGWSGACSGAATCQLTMDDAKDVTATFNKADVAKPTLTVSKAGAGTGKVASSPAGIDCGATCSFAFTQGTVVTLTATPDAGSTFAGWSGACSGTATCQVTMDGAKTVTATFAKTDVTNPTLTVSKAGTGTGKVTSSPAGIDCGATCSFAFTQGAVVTLTATPDAGSTFAGWSGACSGAATCQVTLDAAKEVTATFNSQPLSQGKAVYLPLIRR